MKYFYFFLLGICLQVQGAYAQVKYEQWFSGVKLFRLEDSARLEINTGICAPCFRDMNGDGKVDLLVGEFGNELCPGEDAAKSHPYVQGRCRIYWNYGTNEQPVYRDFTWLESGGKPLFVPITCCVGMTPVFGDLDGDGTDELLSGSYPGPLYRWKMLGGIRFGEPEVLKYTDDTPVQVGYASTVFPYDIDGDGRLDLLITGLYDGVYWAKNAGNMRFEKAQPILNPATGKAIEAGHAVLYDWDADGKADLLCAAGSGGNIFWCRNTGDHTFATPQALIEADEAMSPCGMVGQELQCHGDKNRLCVYDYNGDGKPDLVIGSNQYESVPMNDDFFVTVMKDEEVLAIRKQEEKLRQKMKRYTKQDLCDVEICPEGVPEKLFAQWKKLSQKSTDILQRKLMEQEIAAGGRAGAFGCIWVYYRK